MATKTITGTYNSGYYLQPTYQGLNITSTASVYGAGVTTSSTQGASINNQGKVEGSGNGITLNDGGSIVNGSTSNTYYALIEGAKPIVANTAKATVSNFGRIISNYVFSYSQQSYGNYTVRSDTFTTGPSITLNAGGTVTNQSTGSIANGVLISGASGSVVNNDSIGRTKKQTTSYDVGPNYESATSSFAYGASVSLQKGGTVTNGSSSVQAYLGGVYVSGGTGTVNNFGTIASSHFSRARQYSYPGGGSGFVYTGSSASDEPSVVLAQGGSVTNSGSNSDLTFGVQISGGSGKITNNGFIGGSYSRNGSSNGNYTLSRGSAIYLGGGGSVANNAGATIASLVEIVGAPGTVINNGSIGGDTYTRSYNGTTTTYQESVSVRLFNGGTITNGSATNTAAALTNGVAAYNDSVTVTNFGSIGSTSNTNFDGIKLSGGGTVTNGSKADTTASIYGGNYGVYLYAGGKVTNYGTIGSTNGNDSVKFGAAGTLVEEGTGVLVGYAFGHGGTLELGAGSGPGTLSGLYTSLQDFGRLLVDKGGVWSLTGNNYLLPVTDAATVSLSNSGTLTNHGTFYLGGQATNAGKMDNASDGTFYLDGDFSVASTASAFSNEGTVDKFTGTGTSIIHTGTSTLTDSGTIIIDSGTIELTGAKVNVSGKIIGNGGTIEFGPGVTTLLAGTTIQTGGLILAGTGATLSVSLSTSFAGTFSATAGTVLSLKAGANILTLTGPATFKSDTVNGAGKLVTQGATSLNGVTLGGTAIWTNSGTVTETGTFTLGDGTGAKASFVNASGGVFNLATNVGIASGTGASIFTNQGLLEKTVGNLSTIGVGVTNTGTIEAVAGTIDLQKAVTGTGTLKIDAGKIIQADAAVASTQTVTFHQGNDKLTLTDAADFAGKLSGFTAADTLDLRQFGAVTSLTFVENAQNTAGTLTVKDGGLTASIAMLGQFVTAGFATKTDGLGGTNVTYKPPVMAFADTHLVTPHA